MDKKYIATDISRLCKKGYISNVISSFRDNKRYYLEALHAPRIGAYATCRIYKGQVYVGKILYYNNNTKPDYIYFNSAGYGVFVQRETFFRKV